jgi:xanthine dehydrogenase accessory factor
MKELHEILRKVRQAPAHQLAILATVVDVKGSGYRRPGARMLIDKNGDSIGMVSGGCLEADVLERAGQVLETGRPAVITYDTAKNENSVFSLGMGCRGVVRILLEPAGGNPIFDFLERSVKDRKRGAIATLVSRSDRLDMQLGYRFFADASGELPGTPKTNALNGFMPAVIADACVAIRNDRPALKTYETPYGQAEFFHEVVNPPTSVLIFGGGNDAIPLAAFAGELGWRVSVIDHRPAYATAARFAGADAITVARAEELADEFFSDERSVAVVMTHNYDTDREVLFRLLNSEAGYIGMLGPKKRTLDLLDELRGSHRHFDERALDRLYAPVGLDIGATTPEAIALAIVAEIQTVLAGRRGGFLRDREGGIYDR